MLVEQESVTCLKNMLSSTPFLIQNCVKKGEAMNDVLDSRYCIVLFQYYVISTQTTSIVSDLSFWTSLASFVDASKTKDTSFPIDHFT